MANKQQLTGDVAGWFPGTLHRVKDGFLARCVG
jgi:hypothetical protein